ncbi:septation protein IspZ [Azohydromonas sediminis]|uniref:septation protein IspZ n=1 Tax=Azohydromonas sediminis TaxID=2259674 RepID=UPI000E64E4EF|nr:septation protein IspZ [Azohydromonas sediminis]
MKPLFDLLPAFVFVAVFGWFDDHPAQAAAWSGATLMADRVPVAQVGAREAPALLAAMAALAVLTLHLVAVRWRRPRTGAARAAAPAFAVMVVLVALLALAAAAMGGSPAFAGWKPSVLYWLLGLVLWLARVGLGRNLVRTLLAHRIALSDVAWQHLNAAWVGAFGLLGLLHLWVAYSAAAPAWLQFKVFAGLALLPLFALAQWAYVARCGRRDEAGPASVGAGSS